MKRRYTLGALALGLAAALAGCGGESPDISGPTHAGTTQPVLTRTNIPATGSGSVGALTPEAEAGASNPAESGAETSPTSTATP